jgi:hypothetical protein
MVSDAYSLPTARDYEQDRRWAWDFSIAKCLQLGYSINFVLQTWSSF